MKKGSSIVKRAFSFLLAATLICSTAAVMPAAPLIQAEDETTIQSMVAVPEDPAASLEALWTPTSLEEMEDSLFALANEKLAIMATTEIIIPVTSITNVPATANAGVPRTLTATVSPSNATNKAITWTVKSAGGTGAAITNGNSFLATATGTAVVTATIYEGTTQTVHFTRDFSIVVTATGFVPVTDIIVTSTSVAAGVKLFLAGVVNPIIATNKNIVWSVSDPGTTGATINGSEFTATAAGSAIVTATILNGKSQTENYSQNFTITVTQPTGQIIPVTAITGVPTYTKPLIMLTLSSTVSPANATNRTIVWTVKNGGTTGAAITNGNMFYATSMGMVTVTATIKQGTSMTEDFVKDFVIAVTNQIPVTSISGVPTQAAIRVSMSLSGTVAPTNATYKSITWSVKDGSGTGATINGNSFYATALGTAIITATIQRGKSETENYTEDFSISVTDFIAVTDINGLPSYATTGTTLTLTGSVYPSTATNQTISWSIKNSGGTGATITSGNLFRATSSGTATVTATVSNGNSPTSNFTKDFSIAVGTTSYVAVTNISNVPSTAVVGTTLTLTGTVAPSNATNRSITWSVKSAGTTGATITSTNLFRATATGTATVTATISNGKTTTTNYTQDFTIVVSTTSYVPVTNITAVPTTAAVGATVSLTGTVNPSNATNKTIVWSMKNAGTTGATITSGYFRATATGSAIITATITNGLTATTNFVQDFTVVVSGTDTNTGSLPTTPVTPPPTNQGNGVTLFSDVSITDWFYQSVVYAQQKKLMNGVSATEFAPNQELSRAMLVTILYRLEGSPSVYYSAGYIDVENGTWYTEPISWAKSIGVVQGYSDELFGTNDDITREQFATILYNYAGYKGIDTNKYADLTRFSDEGEISGWARDAMSWANAEELILGRTPTTLEAISTITRAEAATILMRFIENVL